MPQPVQCLADDVARHDTMDACPAAEVQETLAALDRTERTRIADTPEGREHVIRHTGDDCRVVAERDGPCRPRGVT